MKVPKVVKDRPWATTYVAVVTTTTLILRVLETVGQ